MCPTNINPEARVGIEGYITKTSGIGGVVKAEPSHFKVEEVVDLPEFHEDGSYLIIRVNKTNWDTINFARVLSNRLGISQKRIEYSGTKDKRARTIQHYSVRKAGDLIDRLRNTKIKDAEIEVLGKARRGLKLGDLIGNLFEVRITEIDANSGTADRIERIVAELEGKGIPNFFGLQRFGSVRYITHEVGKHLLRRDYSEAFWTYVAKPFELESEEVRKIREELWNSRDARFGLRELPKHLRYERNLLQKLQEGLNEERALLTLPKSLKMMFVHAYQSYIFNLTLSARMKEFESLRELEAQDCVDFVFRREVDHTKVPLSKGEVVKASLNQRRIAFLSAQNRCLLVLPLPGYETKPDGSWAMEREMEFLEKDGISLKDFKHEYKEFSSSGSFRSAEIPFDFSNLKYEFEENTEVKFTFFLPKGCYATVFLREFMKKGS
jgi:tRNA pseudouridine13 synthase